ncbi:MAG TPA: hypothetical protein VGR37_19330 [Longimicrobiaceae bacterium]|nr:hypothetical protein [Longimicrobiaceae bacterium]
MQWSLAQGLNPEAGSHPVCSDPHEIAAARRAGERSLQEFPYYRARYGERGRLFALSDGAWLVTLCAGEWPHVQQQVLWLGGVLASRGMPRLLLERHLRVLHAELTRELPQHGGRYDALLRAADHLRELRRAALSDAAFQQLARDFADQVGSDGQARLPGMGEILVAAVADESAGIARAVRSVEEWCADPGRFPGSWRAAVRATLAQARRSVSPSAASAAV